MAMATQSPGEEETIRIGAGLRMVLDWDNLVARASDEGLAPFLYRRCRDLGLLTCIPARAREFLRSSYRQTVLHNLYLLRFMEELDWVAGGRGLSVVVLKGAALLNSIYEDVGLRPMEDIDLMVRIEDLGLLKLLLEQMGFAPDRFYPDTYKRGIIHVDLHTDFLSAHRIRSRRALIKIQPEKVWDRVEPVMEGANHLYRLSLYDNLIALSFHMLKHCFTRLIWFVDIKEILIKQGVRFDWPGLAESARKMGGQRCLLYVLIMTKHLLGLNVPDDALRSFGRADLSIIEQYILRIRLANEPVGRLSQLLCLFQIREASGRVRFVMESLFPRKSVMYQIFPAVSSCRSRPAYARRTLDILLNGSLDLFLGAKAVFKGFLPKI